MRTRLAAVTAARYAILVLAFAALAAHAAPAHAFSIPRGWPSTLVLGMRDPENGAAALRSQAPLGLRYQYLSGGVNTGLGWQTYAGGAGAFVGRYVADSQANGFLTAFSYYMLQQSAPGNAQTDERLRTTVNLGSRATMTAYYDDLRTFFERAAATGVDPIVLHVEPDAWGYVQRSASGDDARTVPAQVASTGLPELAGLPDDVAGFAQAIVRLRDRYAPNVLLGYHVSVWGTGVDIATSDPPDPDVDALAARSAAFYRSLGANFDLLFFEFADRDAGYHQLVDGAGLSGWWDAGDYRRNERYVGDITSALDRPAVMWQIPLGNTRMLAMDNTPGHYQDNRVQTLLDPARAELTRYRDAGAIGLLFGNALAGTTCACDALGDGVTNPAPIDGNDAQSLSADDDGGFFKQQASLYQAQGPIALLDARAGPSAVIQRFSLRATAPKRAVRRGRVARLSARVTSAANAVATVTVAISGPVGHKRTALRMKWTGKRFQPGRLRSFAVRWHVPKAARAGSYGVVVSVTERRDNAQHTTSRPAATIVVRR